MLDTRLVHVEHQTSLMSHQTLAAKELYEFACRDFGVLIQGYLSDNGAAFSSSEFSNHLNKVPITSLSLYLVNLSRTTVASSKDGSEVKRESQSRLI